MNNAPNIRIEVTEGAQIPDPRDRRLLNAWTLAFCVAVVALVTLCATQPEPYLEIVKFLPDGLIITFEVTALSLLCTLPIGLLTGLGRLSRNSVINLIASTYVEIIRGVPLLVQLFYIYYALGRIIQVPPMVSAVIAISFCWCPSTILYNYLTYFLFLAGCICLFRGLIWERKGLLIAAGVCLGTECGRAHAECPGGGTHSGGVLVREACPGRHQPKYGRMCSGGVCGFSRASRRLWQASASSMGRPPILACSRVFPAMRARMRPIRPFPW